MTAIAEKIVCLHHYIIMNNKINHYTEHYELLHSNTLHKRRDVFLHAQIVIIHGASKLNLPTRGIT
jgi:hypothetical protein